MINNIINNFSLPGDKFMPEMHLRQSQFPYSACGPFTKYKQRIQKFKETGDTNYIYKIELDKACFAHDAAYSDGKDLTKRTIAGGGGWSDLADMQLLSRYNKGITFLLCVIDIFSKYAWIVPLKDKKGVSIVAAFQSILN